jgi:hypothetical protein
MKEITNDQQQQSTPINYPKVHIKALSKKERDEK